MLVYQRVPFSFFDVTLFFMSWKKDDPKDVIFAYTHRINVYTWNLFVLYLEGWTLQNKAVFKQNNGHLGSRYI